MKTVMVIGATRNLGKALGMAYAAQPHTIVYATARYATPEFHDDNVHWINHVDITHEHVGSRIALNYNNPFPIDILYFAATSSKSMFKPETLKKLDFENEVLMYKTTAIGPLFVIQHLMNANLLRKGAKILFIGSEAGSIALRTPGSKSEDFGHHGSQAALNMMTKLLSLELAEKGIAVGVVHAGQEMKVEVTAKNLMEFAEDFGIEKSGSFWAPMGAGDIPTAETALATKAKEVPLQLPW